MESILFVNKILILANNPFFDAYYHSDLMGKFIIIFLILLSIVTWAILIQKCYVTRKLKQESLRFQKKFNNKRSKPLQIECVSSKNPYQEIYSDLKRNTVDILKKNQHFTNNEGAESFLTPTDIEYVDAHLQMAISSQVKSLEKNLFILSTIVSLAPFMGLLGTVWGILTTFSQLQTQGSGSTQQMVLGGISLALATTVLGLIDAIPALIGYNYLKNNVRDFHTDMEHFSTDILSTVEMQYRKVV